MHKSKIVIKKKKVLIHWKELTIQMMIHNKMRIKKIQISIFLLILLKAQENSIKSEIQIMLQKIYLKKVKIIKTSKYFRSKNIKISWMKS